MDTARAVGPWIKQRRMVLDLTQEALAQQVGCSTEMIGKIETDTRRPSRQIAELLAGALELPPEERPAFVQWVRRSPELIAHGVAAASAPHNGDRQTTLPAQESPPLGLSDPHGPEGANPYKGLRAFGEADAPDFFGREALAHRLAERLAEEAATAHFLAVVGPSGSGKSSVVKAGLLPLLRHQQLPGGKEPLVVELNPGPHPFEELEAGLLRVAVNPPASLMEQLRDDERGLARAVKRVLPAAAQTELVLVIDQFEEVFTLTQDEAVRADFLDSLFAAVTDPGSRLWVVATLRADFYDRPLLYAPSGALLARRTEVVVPLTPGELYRAITGPAARAGLALEADLAATIMQDVGEQPGTLPLLQYALTELYERRAGRLLTLAAYRASGGVLGSLARRAESVYAGLTSGEQAEARQLFLRLVTLGDGTEDTRRRVRRAELVSAARDEEALERVLEGFGRYRMLTFDRDAPAREPTVEVAHEALLRTWPRLRAWLTESREALLVQRRLMASAAEWQAAGQEASFLASGARLAQFAELSAAAGDAQALALTGAEQVYIAASLADQHRQQAAEAERQTREVSLQKRAAGRLRVLVGGLALFLLVAVGLSLFAFDRQGAAQASAASAMTDFKHAEAQRLAAEANVLLQAPGSNDLPIAFLAIRSLRTQYTPQGDAMLGLATTLAYPQQQFIGHTKGLQAAAFSPDGKQVLTGSDDNTARLWDAATGQPLRTFAGLTDPVRGVAFAPDGKTILTANFDGTARLWDAATGQEMRQFRSHTSPLVRGVAFSPDGKQVLTGSDDNTALLWDVATGHEVRQFSGHTAGVGYVAFSPDGKQVLTGSGDKTARLWDAATGQPLHTLSGHTDRLSGAVFAPDGKTVLTGGDTTARLWDAQTGQVLRTFTGHPSGVRSVAFAPDGRTVLTGGIDHTVKLWDVATGEELRTFAGHTDQVNGVAFSPDGQSILTASTDGTALLWRVTPPLAAAPFSGHTAPVTAVAFSPNGQYLLTGSEDTTARLWDTQTRAEVRQFAGHTASPSIAFSSDGKSVLTSSSDKIARLWDTQTGAAVITFTVPTGGIYDAVFAPDGKGVLTTDVDNTFIRLWDAQTGQELRRFTGPGLPGPVFGFSPDGTWVLKSGPEDAALRIWDTLAGRDVHRLVGYNNLIQSAVFSPDGKYVLAASADNSARLWDAQTGRQVRQFVGHTASVDNAAFSSDGKYVLTASEDNTARLWDAQTGHELRRFAGHTGAVYGVAFAPSGRQIATASADGTARLWDLDYQDTIRALCGRLIRDLKADERAQYNITDQTPTCPQP